MLLVTAPRIAVYGTSISPEAAIVLAAVGVYLLVTLLSRLGIVGVGRRRAATGS
jgi:hypothetical protein